jgi:pyruvate/2-oxoglutarate/acetoin dehydrogenase E1 component
MNYGEAIAKETLEWMQRDSKALVLGVGVKDEKGIFGTTKLANDAFPDRVIETPLSENMLTGALVGLAQAGWHPLLVHARSDFMTLSMEHIVNSIAKWEFMGGEKLQIGIRCIIGQGWGNGPQHTQSTAHWFTGVPGVATWMPATGDGWIDALGDMKNGPVLIYEHRKLYDVDAHIPAFAAFGNEGESARLMFISYSASFIETRAAAKMLYERKGIPSAVIAPEKLSASFSPASDTIELAVVVDVGTQFGGLSAQASRDIEYMRVQGKLPRLHGSLCVSPPHNPTPASEYLERQWYPTALEIANTALFVMGEDALEAENAVENHVPKDGPF